MRARGGVRERRARCRVILCVLAGRARKRAMAKVPKRPMRMTLDANEFRSTLLKVRRPECGGKSETYGCRMCIRLDRLSPGYSVQAMVQAVNNLINATRHKLHDTRTRINATAHTHAGTQQPTHDTPPATTHDDHLRCTRPSTLYTAYHSTCLSRIQDRPLNGSDTSNARNPIRRSATRRKRIPCGLALSHHNRITSHDGLGLSIQPWLPSWRPSLPPWPSPWPSPPSAPPSCRCWCA